MAGLFPTNPNAPVDSDAMDEHLRALYDLHRNARGFANEMSELRVADNLMSIYVDEFQSYIFGRSSADEMMANVQRLWTESY
jgi:hypothetical protein